MPWSTGVTACPPLHFSGNHSNWEHLCLETSIYYDFVLDVLSFAVIAYISSTLVSLRFFCLGAKFSQFKMVLDGIELEQ